jgi:hypothetical protein
MTPRQAKTFGVFMTVVLVGGLGFGMVTLLGTCRDTGDAIRAYAAAARQGKHPQPLHPNADTDTATRLLATSRGIGIRNFIASGGGGTSHACVWTSVDLPDRTVSMDFFLEEQGDLWVVASLSTSRQCSCPDDEPCRMP